MTAAATTPEPVAVVPSVSHMPTSNPLPLSATQESAVKDLYYARVRGFCADEIRRELRRHPAATAH